MLAVPLIFLVFFYFLPLGEIVRVSLGRLDHNQPGSLVNWRMVGSTLGFTFYQALLSTVLTVILGLPAAYLFSRYQFKGKELASGRLYTTFHIADRVVRLPVSTR